MSQSARAAGKGQRRGRNIPAGVSPSPPNPSLSLFNAASAPSAATGAVDAAGSAANNPVFARQQAQEKKYPLWKHVTRKPGPGEKLVRGGNVVSTCNFCKNEFKSTYYRVKGHLLGLPCGLAACKTVTVTQRREMEERMKLAWGR